MKTLTFLAILIITKFSIAQSLSPSVVSCFGKFSNNSGFTLSATGGEPMTETFSAGNNILTQGFQQPDRIGTGITELYEDGFIIKYFPNPTADFLTVQFHSDNGDDLSIALFDLLGRKLNLTSEQSHNGNEFVKTFQLTFLPAACYFLSIETTKCEIKKKFTIIKTSL